MRLKNYLPVVLVGVPRGVRVDDVGRGRRDDALDHPHGVAVGGNRAVEEAAPATVVGDGRCTGVAGQWRVICPNKHRSIKANQPA